MRVLVTGGAGYVGSITARLLLDSGHEVAVLDSLERGVREAVPADAGFFLGDVGDRGVLDAAIRGCSAVVHCAGLIDVAESVLAPRRYLEVNAVRPLELLRATVDHGLAGVVFSSSAAVYGDRRGQALDEDSATEPVSPYGVSKLAFENALAERAAGDGLRSVVLRYFNAAGAWPDGSMGEDHRPETHLIPRVMRSILSGSATFEVFGGDYPTPDGTCVRDYVHVLDIGRAHVLAVEYLAEGGATVTANLGGGRGVSNLEVIDACARAAGVEVEPVTGARRAGDPAVLVASRERARAVLGWEPVRGGLETIVTDAWRWHSTHPNGYAAQR